jgi:hypothetical protein
MGIKEIVEEENLKKTEMSSLKFEHEPAVQ